MVRSPRRTLWIPAKSRYGDGLCLSRNEARTVAFPWDVADAVRVFRRSFSLRGTAGGTAARNMEYPEGAGDSNGPQVDQRTSLTKSGR